MDPVSKLVLTRRLAGPEIGRLRRRAPVDDLSMTSCGMWRSRFGLGRQRICRERGGLILQGYTVWKVRAISGPSDKPITFESYLAPALDWHELRQDAYIDGQLKGRFRATRVTLGNPPEGVFSAGNYRVAGREEFMKEYASSRGMQDCPTCGARAEAIPAGRYLNALPPVR